MKEAIERMFADISETGTRRCIITSRGCISVSARSCRSETTWGCFVVTGSERHFREHSAVSLPNSMQLRHSPRRRIASHWRHALAGTLNDEIFFTRHPQTAVWVTSACVRIVDACFSLGGGSALHESSPLQRQLRHARSGATRSCMNDSMSAEAKLLLEAGTARQSL